MSECFEEKYICPAACFSDETGYKCGFGRDMGEGTCPYAPILKLLAGAKEVKGPNDKSAMRYKTIRGDTMEEWESYTFWTRR